MEPPLISFLLRRHAHLSNSSRSNRQRGLTTLGTLPIVFASLLLVVVAIQCVHGAYWAAFDAYPDEPSHVVTALMYRQFMLAPTLDPLEFAQHYYSHYPYLAAGHWPPGFHMPAAIWMIVVGAGRVQLLAYLALIMASTATLLFYCVRSFGGPMLAGVFCSLWLLLPHSQMAMTRFMAEGQLSFFVTAAAAAYILYLKSPTSGRGLLFGLLAASAILTKELGLPLALIPPHIIGDDRALGSIAQGAFLATSGRSGGPGRALVLLDRHARDRALGSRQHTVPCAVDHE